MSSHADSVVRRLKHYQSQQIAYNTIRVEATTPKVTLTFEAHHPILNKPRISITLYGQPTADDVQAVFRAHDADILFQEWCRKAGGPMFRPTQQKEAPGA